MVIRTDTTVELDIQKVKFIIKYCTHKYNEAVTFVRTNENIYKKRLKFILFQFKNMFFRHWIN